MHENQPSLVDKALNEAEQCLLRHTLPLGGSAVHRAIELLTLLRGVTWRLVGHSEQGAANLWNHLDVKGIDMEFIITLTDEFALRMGLLTTGNELAERAAQSLNWLSRTQRLPGDQGKFVGTFDQYRTTLNNNWWLLYLYLLHHSAAMMNFPVPEQHKGKSA